MVSHRLKAGGGALRWLVIVAALFLASPAVGRPAGRWRDHVAEASARFGIPEEWIRRVMRAESGGRIMLGGRPITSRAGAMGLMQLMPGTWLEMRATHGLGTDPYDPHDNILAGTAYLRAMYDRFGYPGLFAAYNAGPKRYAVHLAIGRRLPAETIAYVAAIGGQTSLGRSSPAEKPKSGGVFVVLSVARSASTDRTPAIAAASSIFVRLSTASNFARN